MGATKVKFAKRNRGVVFSTLAALARRKTVGF
jgi:hypothetical protein